MLHAQGVTELQLTAIPFSQMHHALSCFTSACAAYQTLQRTAEEYIAK